ncbi:MAG: D-glycero-beta-D-manno-heptose-7-phosphate kinase [Pseudomonadota bacterium]|nr:D-glycero-beta-D-manno-heptose-7-phosphate kinase [Pseudomonadota bacterium]
MSERVDFRPARVLVVGDAMLDRYWFGDVERISPEAPVPVVRIRQFEERLGGAANVARNVASLGAHATLVAIVGNDEPGELIARMAGELGVELRLARDADLPTTIKLRVIGRQQQLLRIDFEESPGPDALAAKLDAVREAIDACDVMVLSDYGKGGLAQVDRMLAIAREAGKPVVVDPKGEDFDRYRGASILTPNRAELRAVVGSWQGEEDLAAKAHALRERLELDALLVTRSEEGMSLFSRDGSSRHVAARAREVYDVSGAGDTVVATLATALAVGCPLAVAMGLANTAGGIVVGKLGTADVTPEELFGS